MKLIIPLIIVFICSCSTVKPSDDQEKIAPPNQNVRFSLPNYSITTLSNGLEVLFIKNSKLPVINLNLLLPTGSIHDSEQKEGLSYMTGNLLRMGTHKRSAQQVAESLEQKGSDLSVSVGADYTIIEATSLSKYSEELFVDFTEVLTEPKFSWSEFSRFRKKLLAQKNKSLDNANSLASKALAKVVFKDHPYGKSTSGSEKSIKTISQKNIVEYYKKYYQPKGATLAVVGDFDQNKVKSQLEELVRRWPATSEPVEINPAGVSNQQSKIHLIHKPEAKQTQVRFAHLGISRNNPDFIPIRVMNTILGSGFSSRLLTEVRVKKGLTYTIGSKFDASKFQGPFTISTFTRHEKVKETIDTVYTTLKLFLAEGVTASELNVAKQYLKGVFPRALETPNSVAYNIMLLKYLGVPLDYLKNYTASVDAVTLDDIKRVAKKYIKPNQLQIVLVSDKSKIYDQVKDMGEIINYKHTDLK